MNIQFDESLDKQIQIKVIGVGGGGCNAINRMIATGFDSVEYAVANTDMQSLLMSKAYERLQIGPQKSRGLGAGGDPQVGRESAEESIEELTETLSDCQILFLMAGFGGGTGTGALPVIAKIAKEQELLTIVVVTKPFGFEGKKRTQTALQGIEQIRKIGLPIFVVSNDKLLTLGSKETSMLDTFSVTEEYLQASVEALHRLLTQPGLINVDFADMRSVLSEKGLAFIGYGEGENEGKVELALRQALSQSLMEKKGLAGAKALLIHIGGGKDLSLSEVNEAMSKVQSAAHPDANIIFGTSLDPDLSNKASVTIIATGLEENLSERKKEEPVSKNQEEFDQKKLQEDESSIEKREGKRLAKTPPRSTPTSRPTPRQKQIVLNFSPSQKGRFEKTDPTYYDGEDLDIPAFIRKKKVSYEMVEEEVR